MFRNSMKQVSSFPSLLFKNNHRLTRLVSNLSYTKVQGDDSQPPLLILHGLLGNRNNWRSISKALSKNVTSKSIYTLDARNHGDSPHDNHMDYMCMADDLIEWMDARDMPTAVVMGHSMGGRTAMAAALNHPSRVHSLVVLDISPLGTSSAISTLPRFVEGMKRLPLEGVTLQQARRAADEALKVFVPEIGIRQFLLSNLTSRPDGSLAWRANLPAIARSFNPHVCTFPLLRCHCQSYGGGTAFIGGANSDYIKPSEHAAIREIFPRASFQYVANAGHWLHADQPKAFIDMLAPHVA